MWNSTNSFQLIIWCASWFKCLKCSQTESSSLELTICFTWLDPLPPQFLFSSSQNLPKLPLFLYFMFPLDGIFTCNWKTEIALKIMHLGCQTMEGSLPVLPFSIHCICCTLLTNSAPLSDSVNLSSFPLPSISVDLPLTFRCGVRTLVIASEGLQMQVSLYSKISAVPRISSSWYHFYGHVPQCLSL